MPPSKPGDPQTFTGSNGLTRQLPSYDPSGGVQSQSFGGTATPLQRTLSQPVVAPDNPTRNMGPRVQGGVIPSASGMEAGVYGGEAKRRLENDLITIGVGRPSVRRGLIEAYTQQQGAQKLLGWDRGPSLRRVERLEARREIAQDRIDDPLDHPQRVIRRNPVFEGDVTEER